MSQSPLPQFSTLPAELRLKIYHLAFPAPHTIYIKNWRTDPWNSMIKGFYPVSPPLPSPLLAINSESRSEYLRSHDRLCAPFDSKTEAPVFFNPRRDMVLLDLSWVSFQIGHPCMELFACKEVLGRLRVVAMDFVTAEGGGLGYLLMRDPLKLFEFLGLFEGLEEFVFVLGREDCAAGERGEGVNSRMESMELRDIEEESEIKEISVKVLERIRHCFKECEGHLLKRLPRIKVQTVKRAEISPGEKCVFIS